MHASRSPTLKRYGSFLASMALGVASFAASPDWFTVHGDPQDSKDDVIQYSLASLKRGAPVTVLVRVSRAADRPAYGGGTYRSFEATAVVECRNERVWYRHIDFYAQPLWFGPVTISRTYAPGEAPVAFKEMHTQVDRFVRAACHPAP